MWCLISRGRLRSLHPPTYRRALPIALASVIGGACLAIAPPARADVIVKFTLDSVTFQDTATLTGTFTVDETIHTITAWDIVYTGGGIGVPSTVFTNGAQTATYTSTVYPGGVIGVTSTAGTQTAIYIPNPPPFDPVLQFTTAVDTEGTRLLIPALLADTSEAIQIGYQRTGTSVVTAIVTTSNHKSDLITGGTLDPPPPVVGPQTVPEPPTGAILGGALGIFLLAHGLIRRRVAATRTFPMRA